MEYNDFNFKIPQESQDYKENSDHIIFCITNIIQKAIRNGKNKIFINTNLTLGLPMENINKIAGPFVEAWAYETFINEFNGLNEYNLINVETLTRLNIADIILQFKKTDNVTTANVDVKATSEDIVNSGKSPNITSYARIRSAYIEDPDFIFIILSLKHKVYSQRNTQSLLMDGVMEITDQKTYDLKYISTDDISYNPALGSGQIQIKDIHYVQLTERNTWEFCQMLDVKYLKSRDKTLDTWEREARKHNWIKND